MITGRMEPQLSGPIGIVRIVGQSARQGISSPADSSCSTERQSGDPQPAARPV